MIFVSAVCEGLFDLDWFEGVLSKAHASLRRSHVTSTNFSSFVRKCREQNDDDCLACLLLRPACSIDRQPWIGYKTCRRHIKEKMNIDIPRSQTAR